MASYRVHHLRSQVYVHCRPDVDESPDQHRREEVGETVA